MLSYIFFKLIFLFVIIPGKEKKPFSVYNIKISTYIICKSGKEKDFAQTMSNLCIMDCMICKFFAKIDDVMIFLPIFVTAL